MRPRPLLRGALVGGTGFALGHHVARRQQAEAEQDAAIRELQAEGSPSSALAAKAPSAPGQVPGSTDMVAELTRLGQLHSSGVLSDAEFAAAKQKLLQA